MNVGKDKNNDLLMSSSANVGEGGRWGVESYLVRIRIGYNKIRHQPLIIYCEAANRGLTQDDIKQQLVIML